MRPAWLGGLEAWRSKTAPSLEDRRRWGLAGYPRQPAGSGALSGCCSETPFPGKGEGRRLCVSFWWLVRVFQDGSLLPSVSNLHPP